MKQVLVVDDSETIRHEVAKAMKQAGFGVVEAADGLAALERARAQAFAIIILDVNMPRMNGLETLEALRRDPATANVPVLMLTTEAERSLVDRARKAGAKGWLIKPAKAALLVSAVTALLDRENG